MPASSPTRSQALFALLGERWNHLILREVFFGVRRFGELQRALGIAPNTLTARLNTLVELDLLERRRYRPDKDWFDYHLTDAAQGIVPTWITMARWAEEHFSGDPGPGRAIRHRLCGEVANPVPTCRHCGLALEGSDLEPEHELRPAGAGAEPAPGRNRRAR